MTVPVKLGLANGAFAAIKFVTVVLKLASSFIAAAISLRVFIVPGAESIKLSIAAVTNAVVATLVESFPADWVVVVAADLEVAVAAVVVAAALIVVAGTRDD